MGDFDDKWTSLKALIFLTLTLRYFFGKVVLKGVIYSVVYHGGSSHFFGIGIYPVSDWLSISIFGWYRSPLFCIVRPFFPQKGGRAP